MSLVGIARLNLNFEYGQFSLEQFVLIGTFKRNHDLKQLNVSLTSELKNTRSKLYLSQRKLS